MIEWVAGSFGVAAVGAAVVGWRVHNTLIALDQRCETAFSDIDVLLKHRHSVLPSLVETVRGCVGHERGVLESIASARAAVLSSRSTEAAMEAEAKLSKQVKVLLQSAESYPSLQASQHFRELRMEIHDVENKITAARRFYNLAVQEFSTSARQFPGSMIANSMRLGQRRSIDIGLERVVFDEPVSVKF
jgi:LemA protein